MTPIPANICGAGRRFPPSDDPQLASWGGQKPDGMPIWVSGSYDPELNLIYYGTGQPEPQWAGEGRKGDNLYSDCIVALDPDTGKLKWWYQNTPHDTHDYDSLEMPVLVDADVEGQAAQAVAAGQSQRLLLRPGPHQWRIPAGHPIRQARSTG